jgi:predicted NUDIX family phosphoesterase
LGRFINLNLSLRTIGRSFRDHSNGKPSVCEQRENQANQSDQKKPQCLVVSVIDQLLALQTGALDNVIFSAANLLRQWQTEGAPGVTRRPFFNSQTAGAFVSSEAFTLALGGLRPNAVFDTGPTTPAGGFDEMEGDPSHKQVIPYLVLRDGPRYLLMQRTAAGADARLHHRYSIGVGGHLNPGDGGLLGGLRREWAEELVADFVPDFRLVGLLNDDTTPVGRVHLGAVYVADAAGRPVAIREVDKLNGRFVEAPDVAAVGDGLETWSRLAFEYLTSSDRADAGTGPIIGAPGAAIR